MEHKSIRFPHRILWWSSLLFLSFSLVEGTTGQLMSNTLFGYWRADGSTEDCENCYSQFTWRSRRHHCRDCGGVFCDQCTHERLMLPHRGFPKPVRVCLRCATLAKALHWRAGDDSGGPAFDDNPSFAGSMSPFAPGLSGLEAAGGAMQRWNQVRRRFERMVLRGVPVLRAERGDRRRLPRRTQSGLRSEASVEDNCKPCLVGNAALFGFEEEDPQMREAVLKMLAPPNSRETQAVAFTAAGEQLAALSDIAVVSSGSATYTANAVVTTTSFARLREAFSAAHRNATEAQPGQELPSVTGLPRYS